MGPLGLELASVHMQRTQKGFTSHYKNKTIWGSLKSLLKQIQISNFRAQKSSTEKLIPAQKGFKMFNQSI